MAANPLRLLSPAARVRGIAIIFILVSTACWSLASEMTLALWKELVEFGEKDDLFGVFVSLPVAAYALVGWAQLGFYVLRVLGLGRKIATIGWGSTALFNYLGAGLLGMFFVVASIAAPLTVTLPYLGWSIGLLALGGLATYAVVLEAGAEPRPPRRGGARRPI